MTNDQKTIQRYNNSMDRIAKDCLRKLKGDSKFYEIIKEAVYKAEGASLALEMNGETRPLVLNLNDIVQERLATVTGNESVVRVRKSFKRTKHPARVRQIPPELGDLEEFEDFEGPLPENNNLQKIYGQRVGERTRGYADDETPSVQRILLRRNSKIPFTMFDIMRAVQLERPKLGLAYFLPTGDHKEWSCYNALNQLVKKNPDGTMSERPDILRVAEKINGKKAFKFARGGRKKLWKIYNDQMKRLAAEGNPTIKV